MQYPKIPLAQTVIQLCKVKNIQNIVISPGSRNAPLTIGFTNDDYFTCYSIVDERCAAFFALGMAQQSQHPTALVCTSGSALLNYYPAIAEAFYSDIPLVVLSADRSEYLIGIGDGQTINQPKVYKNHILYSASLKQNLENIPRNANDDEPAIIKNIENKLERFLGIKQQIKEENEEEINMALNTALIKKGPVHINIPFEEPLYDVTDKLSEKPKSIEIEVKPKKMDSVDLDVCLDDWNNASKKMILVGVNPPNIIEQKWLDELASDNSVIVFTETTSNLHNKEFFPSIDKIIAPLTDEEFKQLQPDILLTFGGLIVSKKIKAFLRKYQPKQHWHVDKKKANDTFFCLEKHIEVSPNQFFSEFLPKLTHVKKSNYKPFWKQVRQHRQEKHLKYLDEIQFSDFKVFDTVLKAIPKNTSLQVGNSSAIRYTQLFNLKKPIDVYCNRGTSGIDGCTSTAIGFATKNNKQTVFVTGDLSFFYDSNALWNNYIPKNFRIILINNGGGGIFRILPGNKDSDNFDTYFETKHNLSAKQLSDMYGLEYFSVDNETSLENELNVFFNKSQKPKILEIFTPRKLNDSILLNYFDYIK
ncbi:MAG TPA: 2-succinyl-5-enolpyruvyl-6-hydroxy-3-cyclohexene-1-carboxylic-acid synthase [Flavobacteriaceae bacterium]|nr:2-succinyl-5-enolpyruvyl-6-hydroxy-3-cyclohexene-1-carboxylic-acid synthase [Flavobacteriaceae bacterium]